MRSDFSLKTTYFEGFKLQGSPCTTFNEFTLKTGPHREIYVERATDKPQGWLTVDPDSHRGLSSLMNDSPPRTETKI